MYTSRVTGKTFNIKMLSVYEDCFILANNVDADKMVAFYLDLYCFIKNQFSGLSL